MTVMAPFPLFQTPVPAEDPDQDNPRSSYNEGRICRLSSTLVACAFYGGTNTLSVYAVDVSQEEPLVGPPLHLFVAPYVQTAFPEEFTSTDPSSTEGTFSWIGELCSVAAIDETTFAVTGQIFEDYLPDDGPVHGHAGVWITIDPVTLECTNVGHVGAQDWGGSYQSDRYGSQLVGFNPFANSSPGSSTATYVLIDRPDELTDRVGQGVHIQGLLSTAPLMASAVNEDNGHVYCLATRDYTETVIVRYKLDGSTGYDDLGVVAGLADLAEDATFGTVLPDGRYAFTTAPGSTSFPSYTSTWPVMVVVYDPVDGSQVSHVIDGASARVYGYFQNRFRSQVRSIDARPDGQLVVAWVQDGVTPCWTILNPDDGSTTETVLAGVSNPYPGQQYVANYTMLAMGIDRTLGLWLLPNKRYATNYPWGSAEHTAFIVGEEAVPFIESEYLGDERRFIGLSS